MDIFVSNRNDSPFKESVQRVVDARILVPTGSGTSSLQQRRTS